MGNDEEIGGGGYYDFSMRTGLYVARIMHHDLVYGQAKSWSWWRAMGSDYKDGLIRVYSTDNWKSGKAIPSKLMWCMGNFSRFIRPGATRYPVTLLNEHRQIIQDGETDPRAVMVSAYRNIDGSWVMVAINYSESAQSFTIDGIQGKQVWKAYRTSDVEGESLKPVGTISHSTRLEPKSITTFVAQ